MPRIERDAPYPSTQALIALKQSPYLYFTRVTTTYSANETWKRHLE